MENSISGLPTPTGPLPLTPVTPTSKSQALQNDLTNLDLSTFTSHCADTDYKNVVLPTDFFAWLKCYFARPDTFAFYRLQDCLTILVNQYGSLRWRLEAIFNLLSHGNSDDQLMRDWAQKLLVASSADPTLLRTADDGRALVDMSLIYFTPSDFHDRIIPYVLQTLSQRTTLTGDQTELWAIGFLSRIYEKGFTRLFHAQPANHAFSAVAETFLQTDRLCAQIRCPPPSSPDDAPSPPLAPRDLAQFVCSLVNMELYPQLRSFHMHTTQNVPAIPSEAEFARFWLPFLHELAAVLRNSFIPMPALQYRPLFCGILESYAWRCPPRDQATLRNDIAAFDQNVLKDVLSTTFYDQLVARSEEPKEAWLSNKYKPGSGGGTSAGPGSGHHNNPTTPSAHPLDADDGTAMIDPRLSGGGAPVHPAFAESSRDPLANRTANNNSHAPTPTMDSFDDDHEMNHGLPTSGMSYGDLAGGGVGGVEGRPSKRIKTEEEALADLGRGMRAGK